MHKNKLWILSFIALFLVPLFLVSHIAVGQTSASSIVREEKSSFNPVVRPEAYMDRDNNKIHDHLEELIKVSEKWSNYMVIVTFDRPVSKAVVSNIESIGGEVLSTWSLIYGAAVRIRGDWINSLATVPGVTFITENYRCKAQLSTTTRQINVRPYVWDTLGFEGDPNHTIAILDTGIDDSHPDLSDKVIYWEDFVGHDCDQSGDISLTPLDWLGHGTHCASIAAGTGAAAGKNTTVEVSSTIAFPPNCPATWGIPSYIEIESLGSVQIEVHWDDKTGNNPDDTLFVILDTNHDDACNRTDDMYVIGDYEAGPLILNSGILNPGKYRVLIGPNEEGEIGGSSIQINVTRPAALINDGHNNFRGVAPNCKIVALKVLDDSGRGWSDQLIDGLQWIFDHGLEYNVVVCSMSLAFDEYVPAIDSAVDNLVSEGFVCVTVAGNGFLEGISVSSPGTATNAITVGAIDDADKISYYSSHGYSYYYEYTKPDVVAPGGSRLREADSYLVVAADTNDKDCIRADPVYWENELNYNDYTPMQGTSMATPHVAGLAALIIQAMGDDWTHSEADAQRVKNVICGTATEVLFGEGYEGLNNIPPLDRGSKDYVEGFGKVHCDAAIEAFLENYTLGSIATDFLDSDPFSRQCWARKVELQANTWFLAEITMDSSADFDLYLFNPEIDISYDPAILANSTNEGFGTTESITYMTTETMIAYLVVKRVYGYGNFNLQAEVTETVTLPSETTAGISMLFWAILGTAGLTSVIIASKRRK